jgi:succinoglycan biosynthesis transport protein ExoP
MQTGVPGRLGVAQAIDEIDLGALGRALWRRKALIFGLTLLAAAIAGAAVNLVTPRYKSEARVLIETRDNIFLRPEAEKTTDRGTTVDQEAVTSQVQLILSRDLARDVIKKLKLGDLPEFDPILRGVSIVKTVLGLFGIIRDPMEMTPEERVLKTFQERLAAYQVEKSRVIAIEFESEDPELAARVTNTVADTYLVMQQSAKQDQTRAAGQWLSVEIDKLRIKVADAEAKVEQYRSRTNLFVGNNNTTLSNQQLGDFNAQLAGARAQKSDAESKARLLREALRTGAPVEFSDIVNSDLMRRLAEQLVTLRGQFAEQSSTLLSQHPRIKELRAQIADLEAQIRNEADRLARSLEYDAKIADARVNALSGNLDQLKRQAASTNEQDVQLRALERDAKSQRDLLESYLAKFREASARDNIGAVSPEARIISSAVVSNTPAWPKKLPTVLVAALAMFVLSTGFVVTGELLSIVPPQPALVRPIDTPVLAKAAPAAAPTPAFATAVSRSAELRSVLPASDGRAAIGVPIDALEGLARELGSAGDSGRRITVVGAVRNIGASFAAITLARSLAKQRRVVLVDLALEAPNLSVIASDPTAPGLAELARGSASFGQIITRDRYSRVHLIMAGRDTTETATIIGSQLLAITLEALARSYDHVVVDAGPLPDVALARFAKLAPFAVLVASELDDPATVAAREQLLAAGFVNVSVLASTPGGPEAGTSGTRAAA